MTLPFKLSSLLAIGLLAAGLTSAAQAQTPTDTWVNSFTLEGEPKYGLDYPHFDYVNVEAPKGGTVRMGDMGGFDTFNPILPKGEVAGGIGLLYESLMTPSLDENNTYYVHLAEALKIAPDYGAVTFRMDADARWHDGEPVTAEDVVWTFEKLIEVNPDRAQYYANITSAEVTAPGEVTFTFNQTDNRELPLILGQLPVLPQHWWEGTNAEGESRSISESTLEPPLGSGPYRLASFDAGRSITYERVEDYWGDDHPTQIGQHNFDEYRIEYFLDLTVMFEAFKGDQFDWWSENQARRWATAYDFPAVEEGRVIKELFPQDYAGSGLMVGFIMNLRRDKFDDPLVREALNYAFDFEELSNTLFYGQYERIDSFFFGLPFKSTGLPEGEELEILESVRDQIPEKVFTTPYTNPVSGDPTKLRENLRTALNLFTEAGYTLEGTQMLDPDGQPFTFEILLNGPTIEPVAQNLVTNLAQIGITATIRTVDSPQFINRARSFDYDMIYAGWAQSYSPGNEQRFFFGSSTADQQGAQNYAGVADPAVDALIEKLIVADDRETQEAATKALDRVLLNKHFVIPSYTLRTTRSARWDRFSRPEELPEFSSGFPSLWWWDEEKAARTGGATAQ
ncbi:microcin C transport system substrate-binding protein [Devosia subaequoris]|uniref:Microcin C transport system substrate-binding protein n=1 Tax=Devosia subaequoris TaxID=395930 RepID=A0A7W6NBL5_9HYPH|nr:extracellular solute-binding protein [Devosia subaequoris]MBB4052018.1 microcin C transport system substrate-binding protein [Devosia subaequoris]MCP1210182.1 extracellular solute-binding protein [Devosia subaequoris]